MKNIAGLSNHPDLKKDMEYLEKKINEYCNNQCEYCEMTLWFRQSVEYILNEFMKEHPECMGEDRCAQINNLQQYGYLTEDQSHMLHQARKIGNSATHPDLPQKSITEILSVFDNLCNFLPCFINWFPSPSKKPMPRYQEGFNDNYQNHKGGNYHYAGQNARAEASKDNKMGSWAAIAVCIIFVLFIAGIFDGGKTNQSEAKDSITDANVNYSEVKTDQTEKKKASEIIEPEQAESESIRIDNNIEEKNKKEKHYAIGETWIVDEQWELTIDDVTAKPYIVYDIDLSINKDDEYEDGTQLVTIDYHYTNLGYESNMDSFYEPNMSDGLYMSLSNDATIVDADGIVGTDWTFPGETIYPQYTTIGATWAAQGEFHVYSDKNAATLTYSNWDGNGEKQTAIFDLSW